MNDVLLGHVKEYEFWVDRDLFEYWQYSHFTLDVLEPGGFSLETPLGKTFKIHYRLFTPEELEHLESVKEMMLRYKKVNQVVHFFIVLFMQTS